MTSVFGFRGDISRDSIRLETVFVFLPLADVLPTVIESALKARIEEERISPDLVVFIGPAHRASEHEKAISDESLIERYERLRRCKGVAFLLYKADGTPDNLKWIKDAGGSALVAGDTIIAAARTAGLSSLSERLGVVTKAPPGAYFRNPSGGKRSYFIRAGLMCRNSIEAAFVAFTLLPVVARASAVYGVQPNIIWVDTVSIAYVAFALLELGFQIGAFKDRPEIRSFSSYAGFRRVLPAPGDYPIFVISASTSGALARDIVTASDSKIDPRAIATILGAFDASYPEVLYTLPAHRRGPQLPSLETLREISVTGEDFLFTPGEPKPVALKRTQAPDKFAAVFGRLQGKGLIHYFKRVSAHRYPKVLLIADNALVKDARFHDWVRKKAAGTLPATVKHIVYQNDEASKVMADIVLDTVRPHCGPVPPTIVSTSELEALPAEPDVTVAIVAAVAGSGMELMRVTKALRTYQPQGSRYFLVGVISARSYSQLAQLRSNLLISDDSVRYWLDAWCEFAPSAEAIYQFREGELKWLERCEAQEDSEQLQSFAKTRREELRREGIVRSDVAPTLPFISLSNRVDAFDVGQGFVLWSGTTANRRCPADVLFSVACWLQHAREGTALPSQDRLDEGGLQQSVIAPDCFLRFTDPVIQASILRCARDSEFDYRSASALSARAREIITKFVHLREESVTEFLMALAFGRMRLCREDAERVIEAVRDELAGDIRAISLVTLIEERLNE